MSDQMTISKAALLGASLLVPGVTVLQSSDGLRSYTITRIDQANTGSGDATGLTCDEVGLRELVDVQRAASANDPNLYDEPANVSSGTGDYTITISIARPVEQDTGDGNNRASWPKLGATPPQAGPEDDGN